MQVGLIVADVEHLKTAQVASALHGAGNRNIAIYTIPFVKRKSRSPLFDHRPNQFDAPHPRELAASLEGVSYHPLKSIDCLPTNNVDIFVMTGGVLIPESKIAASEVRFINAHAGLIPEVRGLDAFKWAVLEQKQVGVTLHEIDGQVDMGKVLARKLTPVFEEDTLHSFAMRHYQSEIDLLVDCLEFLDVDSTSLDESSNIEEARMRMKAEDEMKLEAAFTQYKQRFCQQSNLD